MKTVSCLRASKSLILFKEPAPAREIMDDFLRGGKRQRKTERVTQGRMTARRGKAERTTVRPARVLVRRGDRGSAVPQRELIPLQCRHHCRGETAHIFFRDFDRHAAVLKHGDEVVHLHFTLDERDLL